MSSLTKPLLAEKMSKPSWRRLYFEGGSSDSNGSSGAWGLVYCSWRCIARQIVHLRISDMTTAVELRYLGPGRIREYLMVSTKAEFWRTRMTRETYFVGTP